VPQLDDKDCSLKLAMNSLGLSRDDAQTSWRTEQWTELQWEMADKWHAFCAVFRDDDYEYEHTPKRRSKKDLFLDDIDDVGTPNSTPSASCCVPDGQRMICSLTL